MFLRYDYAGKLVRGRQRFKVVGPVAEQNVDMKVKHFSSASLVNTFTGVSCLFQSYFPIRCTRQYKLDNVVLSRKWMLDETDVQIICFLWYELVLKRICRCTYVESFICLHYKKHWVFHSWSYQCRVNVSRFKNSGDS